ncbi:hypothetical protein ACT8ZS_12615 [Paenibacillus sp. M.A.Huq-84]
MTADMQAKRMYRCRFLARVSRAGVMALHGGRLNPTWEESIASNRIFHCGQPD